MYIVINRTTRTNTNYLGTFPYDELIELLENDNDIIVMSKYSNTIKVPYLDTDSYNYGETKSNHNWTFKDYHYSP
jgi:hypothetical protein